MRKHLCIPHYYTELQERAQTPYVQCLIKLIRNTRTVSYFLEALSDAAAEVLLHNVALNIIVREWEAARLRLKSLLGRGQHSNFTCVAIGGSHLVRRRRQMLTD